MFNPFHKHHLHPTGLMLTLPSTECRFENEVYETYACCRCDYTELVEDGAAPGSPVGKPTPQIAVAKVAA